MSDVVPSESSYSRMIQVISESDVLEKMNDTLIKTAMLEGFLHDEHVAIDASHFEARDSHHQKRKHLKLLKNVVVKRKLNELFG